MALTPGADMTTTQPTRQRRQFTQDFKDSAVRLTRQPGARITQVARDLGIGDTLLRNWIRAAEAAARGGLSDDERMDLARLRRENRILRENEAILKKAAAFFAREHR
jgi:transposase